MQILRARPDDAAALTEIAFAAKRHWGYPERWIVSWTHLLTIEPHLIDRQPTFTAYIDGKPVGFYSLNRKSGAVCLEHLWVLPHFMRRGVGRALFLHAVEQLKALGFKRLEIESDPNAAGFYEHMGARCVATSVSELEGQLRELPVLLYENDPAA